MHFKHISSNAHPTTHLHPACPPASTSTLAQQLKARTLCLDDVRQCLLPETTQAIAHPLTLSGNS
jgi:hypothetical protein